MSWLIFVAAAVLFDSARIYADNYSSDVYFKGRSAVSQKLFFTYALGLVSVVLLAVTGFDFAGLTVQGAALFLLSGFLSSIAGIPYYRALELDNSTNLGIFIQLAPILYLVLGWLFLGDTISPLQLVAFLIILSAPLLIFFTTGKRSRLIKLRAIACAFLYVLIAVIANLIFVKENSTDVNFVTEMALLFLGKSLGNFFILLVKPSWRRRFQSVVRSSKKKVYRPLLSSLAFSLVKDFTYRAALVLAPTAAIASAISDSSEPIVIFFMGILLTLLWPKLGREKLSRKSILVHLIATILVVIGVLLIR
ncbi:EamA family transporter [Candidatus Saccharibacteria bacterium]|nr:EamA family transporter [Candidatus Saccharibacteria bacterium]